MKIIKAICIAIIRIKKVHKKLSLTIFIYGLWTKTKACIRDAAAMIIKKFRTRLRCGLVGDVVGDVNSATGDSC